jgi:HEAT repeat protein
VLDALVRQEHAALLARYAADPRIAVRRFVFDWLPRFRDREMAPILQKGLKDQDPEVQFRAALGLLAIDDTTSGDVVLVRCHTEWQDHAARVEGVLRQARGERGTKWALAKLSAARKDGEKGLQVGALRLLRYLGTKDAAGAIKWGLDAEDHLIKKETINALRAIVDGAAPLEELSVFQAIEAAKEWKGRV